MPLWGRTKKLPDLVAERDALLLRREARIKSLEETIADMQTVVRDRERLLRELEARLSECGHLAERRIGETSIRLESEIARREHEITRREETIREREAKISRLEARLERLENPRLPHSPDDLIARLGDVVSRLPGWCTPQKALWIADHISKNEYKVAAEIGVFAGRSVFPIALAIAANQGHAVYAVDPWENAVAIAEPTSTKNDAWWSVADLAAAKSQFLREIVLQTLGNIIKVLELPSKEACEALSQRIGRTIDFLHVDGAHSEAQSLSDVSNWCKLVGPGGMIVLDDASWPGVRKADEFLASRFEKIEQMTSDGLDFTAYRV
jgi:predicted O-methyltransferase YrrM